MDKPLLRSRVSKAKELAGWIREQVNGRELSADDRTRVSAALISTGLGHHEGIITLLDAEQYGSALALIRSMIDCLVRAQWAAYLASQDELAGFLAGSDPPHGTRALISRLEKDGPLEEGLLSTILSATQWAIVCDFNHGGGRMVVRHVTSDGVSPNFQEEELVEALNVANAWALVCAAALADLAKDPKLGSRLIEYGREIAA